jgi:adenylate cyclase
VIEIERKFLIHPDNIPALDNGIAIAQGYLIRGDDRSLRIRKYGDDYILTFKAGKGLARTEIERALSHEEGEHLFETSVLDAPIIKTRHLLIVDNHTWEIDVFEGENAGLVIAEIELSSEHELFRTPDWVHREVSSDPRFLNSNLAHQPISAWQKDYQALLGR